MQIRINTKNLSVLLSSIILAGTLTSCGVELSEAEATTRRFDIGEHTISIPLEQDPRKKAVQYQYHEGYIPTSIDMNFSKSKYSYNYNGSMITYTNVKEVEVRTKMVNQNGEYIYNSFGKVENEENKKTTSKKEFDTGEHILSIPYDRDLSNATFQLPFYEGYEVVGISNPVASSGGCLLYINIVPVECEESEENTYTTFGKVIEKQKVKNYK